MHRPFFPTSCVFKILNVFLEIVHLAAVDIAQHCWPFIMSGAKGAKGLFSSVSSHKVKSIFKCLRISSKNARGALGNNKTN